MAIKDRSNIPKEILKYEYDNYTYEITVEASEIIRLLVLIDMVDEPYLPQILIIST